MKTLSILVAGIFMITIVSCNEPDTNSPDNACINTATHQQKYLYAVDIASHTTVLAGGVREYRYRETVTGICTDFYILVSGVIEVVDSVDAVVNQETIVTADSGSFALTFAMPQLGTAQDPGYIRYFGDSGSGFKIDNVYPSPAQGELTAGINISFQSQGSEALDSIFFFNHVKNMVLTIGYYE